MQSPVRKQAQLPSSGRALAVCARPGDAEAACGGTLALLAERGLDVRLVVCASGDKGVASRSAPPDDLAATRAAEQRAAAARLGLRGVRMLQFRDGELEDGAALRRALTGLLREFRPDIVLTHDPEYPFPPYLTARDQRVAGRVTLDAAHPCAREPGYFPEQIDAGLQPHTTRALWLFSSAIASTAIDISSTLERKIVAMVEHRSQVADADALRVEWRDRAAAIGAPFGMAAAETFTVVEL